MPEYIYRHPETEETITLFQKMGEKHHYLDADGIEWKRVWTVPQARCDSVSTIDPFDTRKAVELSGKRKGNLGDLFSLSKEMSERRQDKIGGEDPVKRKFFEDYKQKNNGAKHFHDRPDKIETKHATIDFTSTSNKFKEL